MGWLMWLALTGFGRAICAVFGHSPSYVQGVAEGHHGAVCLTCGRRL